MTVTANPAVPRLLAVDTATDTVHLALQTPERTLVRARPGGAQASAALLPALAALMDEAGLAFSDLDAMACGVGPGAFTGLRTACSVVQGLAVGVGCPVLALPTLAAVAEHARQQGAPGAVWAVQDARMGEIYVARFEPGPQGWSPDGAPRLWSPERFVAETQGDDAVWAGNALLVYPLLAAAGRMSWAQAAPAGEALLALARAAWDRGEAADPATLLPLYVRDKVARTTAERLGDRASGQGFPAP